MCIMRSIEKKLLSDILIPFTEPFLRVNATDSQAVLIKSHPEGNDNPAVNSNCRGRACSEHGGVF